MTENSQASQTHSGEKLYGRAALQDADPDIWTMPDGSRVPISIMPDDALRELVHQLLAHAEITRSMIRDDLLAGLTEGLEAQRPDLERELAELPHLDSDALLLRYVPQWTVCSREFRRRASRTALN